MLSTFATDEIGETPRFPTFVNATPKAKKIRLKTQSPYLLISSFFCIHTPLVRTADFPFYIIVQYVTRFGKEYFPSAQKKKPCARKTQGLFEHHDSVIRLHLPAEHAKETEFFIKRLEAFLENDRDHADMLFFQTSDHFLHECCADPSALIPGMHH